MAATSWIVTALLALIGYPLLGINYENNEFNPTSPKVALPNSIASLYAYTLLHLYVIVPSLIVAFCYVKIYQTIRQHNMAAAPSSQEGNSSYGVEEARMTRLLTVIVVGFYICSMPYNVTDILEVTKLLKPESKYRTFYRDFPVFASSVFYPIAYGVMNALFRSEFLKIIRCR